VPNPGENEEIDKALIEQTKETVEKYVKLMDSYKLTEALDALWSYIAYLNTYFDRTRPWILAKEGKKERLAIVLYNTMEGILKVALMALPVMPDSSQEVLRRLGFDEKPTFDHLEKWGVLKVGSQIAHGKPLFEKIDLSKFKKVAEVKKEMKEVETGIITIDDFAKVDLRVAKILNAERVEGSEKLIRMDIDLGELGKRQLVGGLAKHYKPEELVGKLIVVVANLKPRKLFGLESQGMLLAAKYGDKLKLLTVEEEIDPGAKIS